MEIDNRHFHRITSALRVLHDRAEGYLGARVPRVDRGDVEMAIANAEGALKLADELAAASAA